MPDQIHSVDHSKEGVIGGLLHDRDSDGNWNVFNLKRNGSKLWLNTDYNANPENRWNLDNRFVFRVGIKISRFPGYEQKEFEAVERDD
mgnify:CR=1